jgi:pyroglutamyl-peptidase
MSWFERPILLTSFQPWKARQPDNSSDQLLADLQQKQALPTNVICLRRLPVSFELAPISVISEIYAHRPKLVICCGMAESRLHLSIEQWGRQGEQELATQIDLRPLVADTICTAISQDAGKYVCNHLYYQVLQCSNRRKQSPKLSFHALFVHVPVLTSINHPVVVFDFLRILYRLNQEI